MISNTRLEESEHFNSLDHIQKQIISKKTNRDKISLGVNMSELQSFDFWVEKCEPTERLRLIVKDLVKPKETIRICDCWLENEACECDV